MSFFGSWTRRWTWIYRLFEGWTREVEDVPPPKPKVRPKWEAPLRPTYFPGAAPVRRNKGQSTTQRRATKRRARIQAMRP